MAFEFKFPDVGEGIHEGEIVKWRVKTGDKIKEDDVLVEMETAKAIVEIPSPRAGKILELRGKEGDTVKVGDVLVMIETGKSPSELQTTDYKLQTSPGVVGEIPTDAGITLPAREKPETGNQKSKNEKQNEDAWGKIECVPLKGIKKIVAEHMMKSAREIPHVTHMDEFDATALVKARTELKPEADKKGVKLTYLAFIVKAAAAALQKHPALNAMFKAASAIGAQEIIYKKYYNVSIAVDTADGLMLPVVKNADKKDILEIADEIVKFAETCRTRKIDIKDLQGGTFSITNIGSVGGTYATPIITTGQSANLGVMRMKEKPVVADDENGDKKIVPRPVLTLVLSYDHRVVDGAEAARFMNDVIALLE